MGVYMNVNVKTLYAHNYSLIILSNEQRSTMQNLIPLSEILLRQSWHSQQTVHSSPLTVTPIGCIVACMCRLNLFNPSTCIQVSLTSIPPLARRTLYSTGLRWLPRSWRWGNLPMSTPGE